MANFELASNSGNNTLDVRDIIERVEELRSTRDDFVCECEENATENGYEPDHDEIDEKWATSGETEGDAKELETLEEFLNCLKGYGGDEQWEGDWYPVTLILNSYFEEYAQDLAEETGAIDKDVRWPGNHIDWEAAANELQQDYSSEDLDGNTYWYR